MSEESDRLPAIVREAWAMLPGAALDPATSLAESGADSLEIMNLVLRLEHRLGRKIPFDLMTPDLTAPALAALLAANNKAPDDRDPVFLVPGLFGDEPILAAFRRTLRAELRFETLRLPDVDEPDSVLANLRSTAAWIADDIERRRPEGAILLAGFSFGANVSYETAAALLDRGRDVAFVGLLDPIPPILEQAVGPLTWRIRSWRRLLSPRGETARSYIEWMAFMLLIDAGATGPARRLSLASRRPADPRRYERRRRHLLRRLCNIALRQWRPRRLPVFSLFVASATFAAFRGWDALLPRREVLDLGGAHADLLRAETLDLLAATFAEAVLRAQADMAKIRGSRAPLRPPPLADPAFPA